jgi:hypothetical protein
MICPISRQVPLLACCNPRQTYDIAEHIINSRSKILTLKGRLPVWKAIDKVVGDPFIPYQKSVITA